MSDRAYHRGSDRTAIPFRAGLLVLLPFLAACSLPDIDVGSGLPGAGTTRPGGAAAGKADGPAGGVVDPRDPAPSEAAARAAEAAVDPDDEAAAAVAVLNEIRASAGLSPVRRDPVVGLGAQWHADYLWENRALGDDLHPHEEDDGLPGYSGSHYWERLQAAGVDLGVQPALGEVVATHPRAESAVVHWVETAYHRLPLLAPEAAAAGYGHRVGAGAATNVMNLVARPQAADDWPPVVLYPPPDARDVKPWWDGLEWPRPAEPPGGFPSGPVISVQTAGGVALEVDEHTLRGEDGRDVPHVFLSADNDRHLRGSAVLFYANAPLAPGRRYTVRVAGRVGGLPFDETWSFETRTVDLACAPGGAECGAGRSCYHLTEPLACEFEGILPERAPCRHANDCAAGTTCFRGACQAYCALQEGAPGAGRLTPCAGRCEFGHLPLPLPGGALGLCLPPPCDPHGSECGSQRWCTWGGAFLCDTAGTRPAGAACESTDACVAGTSCLDLGGGFRCHALCAGDGVAGSSLPTCAAACPGAARPVDSVGSVGICP
jgi:uncharacterized protein YkwD